MSVKKMSRAYLAVRPLEKRLVCFAGSRVSGAPRGAVNSVGVDDGHQCFSVRLRCTRYGTISTATMTSRIAPTAAAFE